MRESNQITTTKSTYLGSAWYVSIGVADADRIQTEIEGDPKRGEAASELTRLYRDDNFMTSIPIEV